MTMLFILHAETENSSAELIEGGWCGPDAHYYIYSDGTLEIDGSGSMYDYNGFTHAPWYDHRDDITKIVICDGITKLGASAFIGLKHVTELTMPITTNSVVSDSFPAFAGCYRIEKINFNVGNSGYGFDYAAYPGSNSWYQNTPWYESRDSLKSITFADGVTHIGSDAFRELSLTKVILPDTVTSLGNHCFFNCTELTDLTIPVSLNPYGNEDYPAFQGCMAIENVTFTHGNGVPFDYIPWWGSSDYWKYAPWNMNPDVAKKIVICDDVASLGKDMFRGCNISELTIPITVDCVICDGCPPFAYCCKIEKISFTCGKDGHGFDYTGERKSEVWYQLTPWYQSKMSITMISFDGGITHIGAHAFDGFLFYNPDRIPVDNHAVFLSGHTYIGEEGHLYTDERVSDAQVTSVTDCLAEIDYIGRFRL